MEKYEVIEHELGENLFYCVTCSSRPIALFLQLEDARTYIAFHLNIDRKTRNSGSESAAKNMTMAG